MSVGELLVNIKYNNMEKEHKHEYESGIISLGYAMAGRGNIAMCKICHKDFNKETGELEEAFTTPNPKS